MHKQIKSMCAYLASLLILCSGLIISTSYSTKAQAQVSIGVGVSGGGRVRGYIGTYPGYYGRGYLNPATMPE